MHEGGVVMSAAVGPGKEFSFGLTFNLSLFVTDRDFRNHNQQCEKLHLN